MTPGDVYWHACNVGRYPEGEDIIAQSNIYAYMYARDVLKRRFAQGEAAIATDGYSSLEYAYHIIGGRFPEGEAVIAQNPHDAYYYAVKVIRGRWPKAEPVIMRCNYYSGEYCRYFGIKINWIVEGF